MAKTRRSHRVSGLIIGAAVGDALGAPFEFKRAGQYSSTFPKPVFGGIGEMVGGGSFNWREGEFTDDTQMALSLALSILDKGDFDQDHVWLYWRSWAKSARDIGNTTRHSLSFANRLDVKHVHPEMTAANGALMRSFPLALLDKPRFEICEIVLAQGQLTHPHPAASWGAWLGVSMMISALEGDNPLETLADELKAMPDDVAQPFRENLRPDWQPTKSRINNGSVWGCLADAVWAVRNSTTFEETVTRAINLGDDTDTVACVAGAIAGAMYGIQAIPSRWTTYLNGTVTTPKGEVTFDNASLGRLSRKLANLPPAPNNDDEPPAGPVEIEDRIFAANRSGAANAPSDWAIVSLCLVGDRFKDHKLRREIYLIDESGDANPNLDMAVTDAVATIDAFLDEGKTVLVHCHGGRSRTGLILKAWKMNKEGWTGASGEQMAHVWLSQKWNMYTNTHFKQFLVEKF